MICTMPALVCEETSIANAILDHWEKRFKVLTVEDEPFQHFFLEKIWPDQIFHQMLRFLPSQEYYRPLNINQWVDANGVSTRDKCYFSENLDKMEAEAADFWKQVVIAITSKRLKDHLFRMFKHDISLRLDIEPDQVEKTEPLIVVSLTRDFEDYYLKPHTDGHPRIVTAQFYLPSDDSQRALGTSIYSRNGILQRLHKGRFTEVKRMPFLPNSGYAFAVNRHPKRQSYHGRELISKGSGERNSILVSWLGERRSKMRGTGQVWPLNDLV